jgi:hypothetical protein
MTVTPEATTTRRDRTPYIESRAITKKLQGIRVTASNYTQGREVPVAWVEPDFELVKANYPGIYLSYAGVHKADDREVRGPTNLSYAPPGYSEHVVVPLDPDDPDSDTGDWADDAGFDRLVSPYHLPEHPIPYNFEYNISVLTRNYEQNFEIISQLQEVERLPARFGGLEVPEDGTIRTLDLLGGPETSVIRDEDGKRIVQSVYSVRVTAELMLSDLEQVKRVATVNTNVTEFNPYL